MSNEATNRTAPDAAATIETTTEDICRILWNAGAAQCDPDDSRCGLYPDPAGPAVAIDVGGFEVRGWPVRKMSGAEQVILRRADNGNGYLVLAESWIQDRIGAWFTGREGAKLAQLGEKA